MTPVTKISRLKAASAPSRRGVPFRGIPLLSLPTSRRFNVAWCVFLPGRFASGVIVRKEVGAAHDEPSGPRAAGFPERYTRIVAYSGGKP